MGVRSLFLSPLASTVPRLYVIWKGQPGFSTSQSGEKNNTYQEFSVHMKDAKCSKLKALDKQGFERVNCK